MPRIWSCTCRALILLWTFSWDKTLAGSVSVRTWSARKMLSWDKARDPIIPWGHLWKTEEGWRHGLEPRTESKHLWDHVDTHAKSSSDPSPFPAVMSLADWLSLASPSPPALLLFPNRRVLRDFSLDFLRPDRGWDGDRSRSEQLTHTHAQNTHGSLFL